jgi:hypothetical protein
VATLVTGYVRLNNANRAHDRYLELGRRLVGLGLPTICYYDGHAADLVPPPRCKVLHASLGDCWMAQAAANCSPPPGTPLKDTTAYCVVQHQKTAWIEEAAAVAGLVVWVDFGIFHLPCRLTDRHVRGLFDRVLAAPPDRITIPGIWPMRGRPMIAWHQPAWYVAGGVVVMPQHLARWFHDTTVTYASLQMEATRQTTWEVNTWSAILRDHPDKFHVYAADHNETLFTGYGGPAP